MLIFLWSPFSLRSNLARRGQCRWEIGSPQSMVEAVTLLRLLQAICAAYCCICARCHSTNRTNIELGFRFHQAAFAKNTSNLHAANFAMYCIGALQMWKSQQGGFTNLTLSVSKSGISSLVNPSKFCYRSFRSFLLQGAAIRVRLGTERRNTVVCPRNNSSPVPAVEYLSLLMESAVHVVTSRRPGRITWPR